MAQVQKSYHHRRVNTISSPALSGRWSFQVLYFALYSRYLLTALSVLSLFLLRLLHWQLVVEGKLSQLSSAFDLFFQRQVPFMKITVYSADSAKLATAAAAKCSRKNILGTALLDMSSFIDSDESIQVFSLPVKSNGSKRGQHIRGWLILGLQYSQNKDKGIVPSMSLDEIRGRASTSWMNVLCDPSIVSSRPINDRNIDSDFEKMFSTGIGTPAPRLEAVNSEIIALHLAMSSLELTTQVAECSKLKSDYLYILQVRAGLTCNPVSEGTDGASTAALTINTWEDNAPIHDDPTAGSAIAAIDITSGQLKWESADVTISCMTNTLFTPVIYLSLYQGRRLAGNQVESGSCVFIGETTFFLPKASLTRGAPINIASPLRDLDGTRVAMLQLGAQRTSLTHSAGGGGAGQQSSTAPARLRSATRQREGRPNSRMIAEDPSTCISVSFSIDEGSVMDPFWRQPVEPFFEFTLLPPRGNNNLLHNLRWRARTSFIGRTAATSAASSSSSSSERASDTRRGSQVPSSDINQSQVTTPRSEYSRSILAGGGNSPWGIGCSLLIPKVGFPVGPADEAGRPIWSVAVVCRDASRAGCPEIASARVGLPWSLLARGRSIDQWVVLLNTAAQGVNSVPPEGVNLGMDMVMRGTDGSDKASSPGRIRLNIACRSLIVDQKGLESSSTVMQESWAGVSALQQFQSQFFGGSTNNTRVLGHTQVKGGINPGIGASLIWLSGLATVHSGQEIEPLDITMASASSLIAPVISQSHYEAIDSDMAADERLTFSELFFSPSGNTCRSRGDVNQATWSKWEEDWMPSIPYLRGLCGSLPVAGGHSHLRLDVSVSHRKMPYTVSFSVLSGLTACMTPGQEYDLQDSSTASSSSTFGIPAMDILMSSNEDHTVSAGAVQGRKVFAQQLRGAVNSAPRLKLSTAFVPFVKGRLTISCRSIRFALPTQQSSRHADGRSHRCAIRFAMSSCSFGFTPSFEIPITTDTVITMSQLTPTTHPATKDLTTQMPPSMLSKGSRTGGRDPNSQRSLGTLKNQLKAPGRQKGSEGMRTDPISKFSVILPVDTLELTSKGGSCSMLTLQVSLLDLDGTGSLYSLGDGGMQTAPLYYQALRAASASRPLTVETSTGAAIDPVGISPWLTAECAIYDKQKQEPVAWVSLSTQFLMEEMSPQVMSALSSARQSPAAGYGEVDQDPLSQISPDFTGVLGGTYGDSDPDELLVLSGTRSVSPYYPESRNGRPNTGVERVRHELGLKQAFLAADVNGSGSVSVEELLAVIKQGSGNHQKSKGRRTDYSRGIVGMEDTVALLKSFAGDSATGADSTRKKTDPQDLSEEADSEQVVRRIFNRLDVDGDGAISWWEWQASLSGALLGRNPCEKFIDPMDGLAVIAQAAVDALMARRQLKTDCESVLPACWDTEYIDASGSARLPMVEAVAGSVTRLQSEIASIRGWGGSSSTTALTPMAQSSNRDSALVAAALKKQMEAEAVAEECRLAHRNESNKRSALEASLANLKRLNDEVRGARDDKEEATRQLRERLTIDAVGHQKNLDSIQAEKKRRLRATIIIDLFLTRTAIPRYKRIQLERNRAGLSNALVKLIRRHRVVKSLDLRTRATLLLQRMIRGALQRVRLRKRQTAAMQLQRVYRGFNGRGKCQRLLLDQAASCFSAKYLAAAKIKFVLQRFVKKIKARRNDAAVTLQRASRRRANRKATEKQRRDDAASLIGKVARGKAAVTAAKSHKDTLLLERQRDEESDSALRSIQRLRENVAAGVIQAASRGR